MAESQFRTGSPRERAPPRGTVSAPQVQSCPSQQLNILSYKTVGQPSDYAPVAGASLSRLMEGQPAKNVSFFEWWHWKWHNWRRTRLAIETFNGVISAFSAGVYVYDAYITITHVARIVYFISAWTILVEYLCKLFASNNKLKFLFWSASLIDAATIGFGLAFYFDTEGVTNGVSFIRALRMLQVVRFMRVLIGMFFSWLKGAGHPSQVELYKHLFDLLMTVGMVVFIGGCAFYEIEQVDFGEVETSPTYLHEGIYWACVTLTTVGYGDFYPTNVVTQMLFPVMIGIILVIIPAKVSALNAVMDSITPYMRRHHTAYRFGEHVVLMGHINHKTIKAFVDEFFAPDHGLQEMQLVLLRTDPPGPDMRVMVSGHHASHRLTYLQGSPFVVEDLFRTDLTRAMAVFVMCNKYAQDVEKEDTNTLMIVLALSQYIRQNTDCGTVQWSIRGMGGNGRLVQGFGSESWKQQASKWMASNKAKDEVPHIIVQFHLPESVQRAKQLLESQANHPLELGLLPVGSTLFPMCLGSIKHSMIGASLRTPGLLTLIANLTMSCEVASGIMPDNSGWICEYLNGAGIEMYEVQLPFEVHGMTYAEAVVWLYEVHGVILLGLRLSMCDLNEPERYNVHLAPFNAEELHLDVRIMMGIIMSQDDNFTGPPQGPRSTEPDGGIRPVPGRRMDLNTAMVVPENGECG
mmetsp:Transcript_9754/g.26439  ORF Transcript_9754/g.26439 Transcript_9754/m.26439 type:complete len:690 (+) Transcript_9754:92-2161(+)